MADLEVKIIGLGELLSKLKDSKNILRREFDKALWKSAEVIKQKAQRKVGSPPTVYQGTLARSIDTKVSNLKAEIYTDQIYAKSIEFGRPAGSFPPSAPLEEWASKKLGVTGLGFVIARKIGRRGTKAQPFMTPALEQSVGDIERIMGDFVEKALEEIAR